MPTRMSYGDIETRAFQKLDHGSLLDGLPDAVYLCDRDGYVTIWNKAAERLWGVHPEKGKHRWTGAWKMYTPEGDALSAGEAPMAIVLKTGKAAPAREIVIERPNGDRATVISYARLLHDEQGNWCGGVNTLVEVATQNESDGFRSHAADFSHLAAALRRSEERYHRMISEVEDYAILLLSRDGIIENWNKGAEKIKGYSGAEVIGRNFRIFYTPEDRALNLPEKLLHTASTTGRANHEGWRVRKDGTHFWASTTITALHDDHGEVIGFSKVTRDLTERRNAELALQRYAEDLRMKNALLRDSEERYHRMISEVQDYVIILLSPGGIVENWNKGAEKIKGYTANEVVGQHFEMFYSEYDRKNGVPARLLHDAAELGRALHEGWRIRKDGTAFWGSVVITALHNGDGKLIGFTKVTRDLTEKKLTEDRLIATTQKLEEQNRELERMNEELSSFAYISSHDLQEPLRKIQTFSDRILELEYDNLSDKGKDYFERMQRGASRMQKLIRDILAYSRTTTTEKKFERTDLNGILQAAQAELEVMITEKKAVIESDRLPVADVIPFQVQQLFTNLLNNALKFSKEGSPPRVRINFKKVSARDVPGYSGPRRDFYHIAFKDNGIGFEPAYARKIFEVFQRLHGRSEYGGTGIGLAICKKIVENHQGAISADSSPGEGSIFHLYLPISR